MKASVRVRVRVRSRGRGRGRGRPSPARAPDAMKVRSMGIPACPFDAIVC